MWATISRLPRRLKDLGRGRQISCGNLCDVEKLRGTLTDGGQAVAEHGVAERAGGGDDIRACIHQLLGARVVDAAAHLLAQEGQPASRTAAEAALPIAGRFNERSGGGGDGAGLVVNILIAAEVAGVVVDNGLVGRGGGREFG